MMMHTTTTRRTRLHALLAIPAALCLGLASPAVAVDEMDRSGVTDRTITLAIETDLAVDRAVPAHRVDVTTRGGVVTLSGIVESILAKEQAVDRAMAIKGVRSVVDRIVVDPADRPDRAIRTDVEQALLTDPATDSYEVTVAVADGAVTLTGTVDSWQEKQLSEQVAKGVRDVVSVDNRIEITGRVERSDYEIEADVEGRLAMNTWLDARLLDVAVEDGVVTLSGTVGSAAEKRRAERLSWIAGVTDVEAEDVEVNWWAEDQMQRDVAQTPPADAEIEAAVEAAMLHDPRVFAFSIDAHVNDGAVTLTGTVDNAEARVAAERNARNTVGVWRVKNHVRVRPTAMPDDTVIATNVRDALARDPYVERHDVDVDVIGGQVFLEGDVNTSFERRRATVVASRVNGVIDVENMIEFDHKWTWQPDREIRDDVESQLFWSPFVDSTDITVSVDQGVVTLTGTVEDWSEWHDAMKNAFEGSAKDVRNQLRIVGT